MTSTGEGQQWTGRERGRERERRERVKERYWSGTINKRIFTQRCLVQPDPNYESKPHTLTHTHTEGKSAKSWLKNRTSLPCALRIIVSFSIVSFFIQWPVPSSSAFVMLQNVGNWSLPPLSVDGCSDLHWMIRKGDYSSISLQLAVQRTALKTSLTNMPPQFWIIWNNE